MIPLKVNGGNRELVMRYLYWIVDKCLISELEKKNIYVPDVSSRVSDVDLLLGADALGLIHTGKLIKLECGLMAVETHLGFVLMGKDTKINQAKSLSTVNEQLKPESAMSMLSNQILSLDLKKLWSLETIRIRDPVENLKGKELNTKFIKGRVRELANNKNRLRG
ncbi:hypothetical protein TNCV_4859981 [Trichonephila clavipes]|nr:hypothetical protein TNCV_4859981 [Trichonephila clavipes]